MTDDADNDDEDDGDDGNLVIAFGVHRLWETRHINSQKIAVREISGVSIAEIGFCNRINYPLLFLNANFHVNTFDFTSNFLGISFNFL